MDGVGASLTIGNANDDPIVSIIVRDIDGRLMVFDPAGKVVFSKP